MNTTFSPNSALRIAQDRHESYNEFVAQMAANRWTREDRRTFRHHRRIANRLARDAR
jgi:hypothetical protein